MKPETKIYDIIKNIIPDKSEKTIFYFGITDTSHEAFFYSYIEGKAIQCFTLAEQMELDENILADVFSKAVEIIKESKLYDSRKYNVCTIAVDKNGIRFDVEYHDIKESEYRIQKAWKEKNKCQ